MSNHTFAIVEGVSAGFGSSDPFGASPDGLGLSVRHLGADAPLTVNDTSAGVRKTLLTIHAFASLAGCAIGAYHGYKRNDSVGWAIGWSIFGSLVPYVAIPLAYAQGIDKHKRESR